MNHKRPDFSGHVVHAMNRRVDRKTLFFSDDDYWDFRSLLSIALDKYELDILEWVIMPNHWHLLLNPEKENQVPDFMQWLTSVHAKSVREKTDTVGNGAVYQSRYRAFLGKPGRHLDYLRNYLAMNPVKAGLVDKSTDWKWGSAKRALNKGMVSNIPLSIGPKPHPTNLEQILTDPNYLTSEHQSKLMESITKAIPFGDEKWVSKIIEEFDLHHVVRSPGRPPVDK